MAEFLCNQLYQHLILMDGTAIYAPIKCTYLPTKTLPSGKAARLHTRLNAPVCRHVDSPCAPSSYGASSSLAG